MRNILNFDFFTAKIRATTAIPKLFIIITVLFSGIGDLIAFLNIIVLIIQLSLLAECQLFPFLHDSWWHLWDNG